MRMSVLTAFRSFADSNTVGSGAKRYFWTFLRDFSIMQLSTNSNNQKISLPSSYRHFLRIFKVGLEFIHSDHSETLAPGKRGRSPNATARSQMAPFISRSTPRLFPRHHLGTDVTISHQMAAGNTGAIALLAPTAVAYQKRYIRFRNLMLHRLRARCCLPKNKEKGHGWKKQIAGACGASNVD